jgi:Leucine-rich repeat (LRR) protein
MKKYLTVILIITVLLIGGWIIYDRTKHKSTTANSYGSNSSQLNTAANGTAVLDYSHHNLTSINSDIYSQINATQLILSYNSLSSLPSQMGNMDKLQVLKVDHNLLEGSLIGELRKMPLISLDASYNNMTGVPAEIGQLSSLQTLNYSYNKITAFPNEMANIKQLKTLNITGNPLSSSTVSKLKTELPNTNIIF